ncbi:unnamed protein product [Mycena citricolor]|uniref:Agmatinase n=1 Tax=Mycena citricolor TaxID=2018698 RepID=A0AAD2HGP2_9AGAR|nr:unnamed protein product [Mycena citricolor]
MKFFFAALALALVSSVAAHDGHEHEDQMPFGYVKGPLDTFRGFNDEVTADSIFSGITTFAKLPWVQCLGRESDIPFDIAFLGAPFDTATSYRPGARFGPSGIREGSRRLTLYGGYNVPLKINPFKSGLRIVDCGDIPVTPYDNKHAIQQIEDGHKALLQRQAFSPLGNSSLTGQPLVPFSLDGKHHPRIITLGGDHTIVLPLLRSINSVYGKISVIHFDSHLGKLNFARTSRHGSPRCRHVEALSLRWRAERPGRDQPRHVLLLGQPGGPDQERIINCKSSSPLLPFLPFPFPHGAIRTTLSGPEDYENDDASGFQRIEAREIDTLGTAGIISKIRDTVGDGPVYLSIDIDSIDPAFAPATGTPETGGWSTRELRTILRGLEGLHIVSADIVEVAPAYDTNAELTTMAAADILFEVMSVMAKTPLGKIQA